MPAEAVKEGVAVFATILGTIALLAAVATGCEHCWIAFESSDSFQSPAWQTPFGHPRAGWFLLFHFALKKLPPVQEALGLK
jgi:hypothetical protein